MRFLVPCSPTHSVWIHAANFRLVASFCLVSLSDLRTIKRCAELFGATSNRSSDLVAKQTDKMPGICISYRVKRTSR